MLRRVLSRRKVHPHPNHWGGIPRYLVNGNGLGLIWVVTIDSGSESDVPLKKRRKLDDTSRASTPRLSTPKGTTTKITCGD